MPLSKKKQAEYQKERRVRIKELGMTAKSSYPNAQMLSPTKAYPEGRKAVHNAVSSDANKVVTDGRVKVTLAYSEPEPVMGDYGIQEIDGDGNPVYEV